MPKWAVREAKTSEKLHQPGPRGKLRQLVQRCPNVRSASVVGRVGAGGIGVVLWEIIRGFQYAETCAVMLIIVVTVSVIDLVSARIRKALV